MPLNLHPQPPPVLPPNKDDLHLVTWNSTGSRSAQKLEQIAELVWGPQGNPSFNDLVVIQEFAKQDTPDTNQLIDTLELAGWIVHKTDDEGGKNASSNRCYLAVWNPNVLTLRAPVEFVENYSVAPQPPPVQNPSGRRQRKPPQRYDPVAYVNNPPLLLPFQHRGIRQPLHAYTWHVTPFLAASRVREWPTGQMMDADAALQIGMMVTVSTVVAEMQSAGNKTAAWLLAGDLNVKRIRLTSGGQVTNRPPFPLPLGFGIASSKLDHIVARYGVMTLAMTMNHPGAKIGDHAPLGAVLTFS